MSLYAANLAVLKERFPDLAAQLPEGNGSAEFRVQDTPSGNPTLLAAGALVHSGRDPRREAERLALSMGGREPVAILGFGLGYLGEALRRADGERPIVVVEKRPELLRLALETRDLRDFLGRGPLVFQVGGRADGVIAALQVYGRKSAAAANPALRVLDAPWYDEVERQLRFWNEKEAVNAATLRRFGRRWISNLAANLPAIPRYPGVALLESRCRDFPALILAAGPSLDRVLPLLPELAERCLVISVDTALRACQAAGVRPDFVLVADPQYWNARHLDRCAGAGSCLISETAVYPSVLRHPFDRIFLSSGSLPLGRFVEGRVDAKGRLGAGGSVATTAWDFARIIGAGPLWFAGLDLGFPGLKTHFRGALFEERSLAESGRLRPAETLSVRALRDGLPYYAPAADGGSVLTDKRLSLYASWFAGRFEQYPQARPRSLSPGGLAIPGMERASVEELLELPIRRGELNGTLRETFGKAENAYAEGAKERQERYEAALDELVQGLRAFIRRAEAEDPTVLEKSEVAEIAACLCPAAAGPAAAAAAPDAQASTAERFLELAESARFTLDKVLFFRKGRADRADTSTNGD